MPIDEEEMRRWFRNLIERGYTETTARNWVSRIRTAYAHGVTDEAMVDAVFVHYANPTRCCIRQALRELEAFRRSSS